MISLRTGLEAGAALAVIIAMPFIDHAAYQRGKTDEQVAQEGRNAMAYVAAQEKTAKAAGISAEIGVKVETALAKDRIVTKTLIREVTKYVPAAADAQCVVPVGFVRFHDQAAAGVLPQAADPAGQPADAASGVALSAVGAAVAENYGGCREDAKKLKGWQDWYDGLAPIFRGEGQ